MSRLLWTAALVWIVSLAGCTAPDMVRAVMGGVNSDQAQLNKTNVQNGNSFPAAP